MTTAPAPTKGVTDPVVRQLDAERKRQQLSIGRWADLAGVTRQTAYELVHGARQGWHNHTIYRLAAVLHWEIAVRPSNTEKTDE